MDDQDKKEMFDLLDQALPVNRSGFEQRVLALGETQQNVMALLMNDFEQANVANEFIDKVVVLREKRKALKK